MTQTNEDPLIEIELKTCQEIPEVQVVERPRPPRAAHTVAVPQIVLWDGIQQRGGVQTVDIPAPQVEEAQGGRRALLATFQTVSLL